MLLMLGKLLFELEDFLLIFYFPPLTQNQLNSALNANHDSPIKRQKQCIHRDEVDDIGQDFCNWVPNRISGCGSDNPVKVILLCGADVLESFAKPGLWNIKDVCTFIFKVYHILTLFLLLLV